MIFNDLRHFISKLEELGELYVLAAMATVARLAPGTPRDDFLGELEHMHHLVLGEDVGPYGGAFGVTQGLFEEFGVRYLDCEGGATILDALHGAVDRLRDQSDGLEVFG